MSFFDPHVLLLPLSLGEKCLKSKQIKPKRNLWQRIVAVLLAPSPLQWNGDMRLHWSNTVRIWKAQQELQGVFLQKDVDLTWMPSTRGSQESCSWVRKQLCPCGLNRPAVFFSESLVLHRSDLVRCPYLRQVNDMCSCNSISCMFIYIHIHIYILEIQILEI